MVDLLVLSLIAGGGFVIGKAYQAQSQVGTAQAPSAKSALMSIVNSHLAKNAADPHEAEALRIVTQYLGLVPAAPKPA